MHAPMAQRDALNKIWAGSLLKLALGSGFQPLYEIKDYFGEVWCSMSVRSIARNQGLLRRGVVFDECSIAARASSAGVARGER